LDERKVRARCLRETKPMHMNSKNSGAAYSRL
jgi:hypothetical protein